MEIMKKEIYVGLKEKFKMKIEEYNFINKRRNLGQFLPLPKKAKGFPCSQYNEETN